MNHYSLARKYRPQTFSDLIGQDVLVRIITNAISLNKLSKAFLLTGTRGIGKTTTARIIAKSINCTENKLIGEGHQISDINKINPCNKCKNCELITKFNHPDVIEIDAATNTGVDDIRGIKETAYYMPSIASAKIYIIDEAHMLSNSAFNALLKIIEEPPENVYWIFTTTEIKKIPITIISRCQNFLLNRIERGLLVERLKNIAEKEGYNIEKEALEIISYNADGSMRDGISLLEQSFMYSNNKDILTEDVRTIFAMPNTNDIIELLHLLVDSDINGALNKFQEISKYQYDYMILMNELLKMINKLINLSIFSNNKALSKDHSEEESLYKIIQKTSLPNLDRMWQILFKGIKDLETTNQEMLAKILIIRLSYINKIELPFFTEKQPQSENNNKIKESSIVLKNKISLLSLIEAEGMFELYNAIKNISITICDQLIQIENNNLANNQKTFVIDNINTILQRNNLSHYTTTFIENKKSEEISTIKMIRENFSTIEEE